jgi:proteic killer suppression protein
MKIRNVLHRGLRRFIEDDDKSGIQAAVAEKLRRIISFLQDMEKETELKAMPNWKAHQLTGDRKGTWSLSVTKNWRLTFRIDQTEIEIIDLDYEGAALSSEMALRIEKAFGVSMDTLMRMQNSYDIAQARRRAGQIKVARFVRKVGDPGSALA